MVSSPCSLSCSLSPSRKGNWWTPGWPLPLRGQHPQNSQMSEFRATAQGLRFRAYPCGARPLLCSLHTTRIPLHTCCSAYRLGIRARICRTNGRRPFGDVTEDLIDHCWINKCMGFWRLLVCSLLFMIRLSFAFSGRHFKSLEYFWVQN